MSEELNEQTPEISLSEMSKEELISLVEYYKTKEDLMALLIKTPILIDFSEINESNMINETILSDNEKLDKYISENITDKGILLIRRYYGITAIK